MEINNAEYCKIPENDTFSGIFYKSIFNHSFDSVFSGFDMGNLTVQTVNRIAAAA